MTRQNCRLWTLTAAALIWTVVAVAATVSNLA
jgi:hypothetical protein